MKTLIALSLLSLSLSSFASQVVPGHVKDLKIESVHLTKVATDFRSRECTEYDSQFVDCSDAIAFRPVVEVFVSYTDSDLSLEDQSKFLSEKFEVSSFSAQELKDIRSGRKAAKELFTLSVSRTRMTYTSSICESEYGCVNTNTAPVEFETSMNVKLVDILKSKISSRALPGVRVSF